MEKFKNKLKDHGGFTLIEMLVVVAIIAILVAVSIPMVSNALERTKHATDAANERAAKAEILVQYLADDGAVTITEGTTYYYDAVKGMVSTDQPTKGYGKHDRASVGHKDQILAIRIHKSTGDTDTVKTGEVEMQWLAVGGSVTDTAWAFGSCTAALKVDHTT